MLPRPDAGYFTGCRIFQLASPASSGRPYRKLTYQVSPRLTRPHVARPTATPQTLQRTPYPLPEGFDRIFRNEGAAGSNPASST